MFQKLTNQYQLYAATTAATDNDGISWNFN